MDTTLPIPPGRSPASATSPAAQVASRVRLFLFTLEGLHSLSGTYFLNFLFFYMRDHFGFGDRRNMLLVVLHGAFYLLSASQAGRFGGRVGYLRLLRITLFGTALATLLAALAPKMLGYSSGAVIADCAALVLWTVSISSSWPMQQALLSKHQPPDGMIHPTGIYNVVWACTSAFANISGGAILQRFGGEALFWLPFGIHVLQLAFIPLLSRLAAEAEMLKPASVATETVAAQPARSDTKSLGFLYLAWLANPFAYVAIYGVLPVIPMLSARLGYSDAYAGFICYLWFWVRLGSFVWFWLWPGWHYRFRWLLASFIALPLSFIAMLLSTHTWMLVVAQVVFGLAVGLIYYSSLYYSMDTGALQSKRGGFHEAAIGLGVCAGPAIGASALTIWPDTPSAGTWAITATLVLGVVPFLLIRAKCFGK